MKAKVLFYMIAYNAQEYISETIESILSQTDKEWTLCILNNGSTDNTLEICKKYEKKDKRITWVECKENFNPTTKEKVKIKEKIDEIFRDGIEYCSIIDSDDNISSDFIEIMYKEAKMSNADITCCGTYMFNDGEKKICFERIPLEGTYDVSSFTKEQFMNNYGTLRPLWGKLYKAEYWNDLLKIFDSCPVLNGRDTYTVLTLMNDYVGKVRFTERPLYYYRIRKNSYYNSNVDIKRCDGGRILLEIGKKLVQKMNLKDEETRRFLYGVYFNHIKDLLIMLPNAKKMTIQEKIDFIEYVFIQEDFRVCAKLFQNEVKNLMANIVSGIIASIPQKDIFNLFKSYVFRMYLNIENEKIKKLHLIWQLSILCDDKNLLKWGNDDTKAINASNKKEIINSVNKMITNEHINKKQKILDNIESNRTSEAIEILTELINEIPLDREVLYFAMYLATITKNFDLAFVVVEVARVFWGEDEEITNMIDMVYNEKEKFYQGR